MILENFMLMPGLALGLAYTPEPHHLASLTDSFDDLMCFTESIPETLHSKYVHWNADDVCVCVCVFSPAEHIDFIDWFLSG